MDGVVEGSRNDNAARLAGNLIAKNVSIDMVEFFVQQWNLQNKPPLSRTEISTTVNSIFKTHQRKTSKHLSSEKQNTTYKNQKIYTVLQNTQRCF